MPDCDYDIKSLTVDEGSKHVSFFAVFSGTHTGEGGPPPTGLKGTVDYVYVLEFSENKIKHATKNRKSMIFGGSPRFCTPGLRQARRPSESEEFERI